MRRQNGVKRQYKRIQRNTAARGIRRGLLLYYWGVLLRLWAAAMPDLYPHMPPPPVSGAQGGRGRRRAVFRPDLRLFLLCLFLLFISYFYIYYIYNYISIYVSIIYMCLYIYLYIPLLALATAAAPHMNTRTSARRADHTTATPGAMQKNKGDSPSKKRV